MDANQDDMKIYKCPACGRANKKLDMRYLASFVDFWGNPKESYMCCCGHVISILKDKEND